MPASGPAGRHSGPGHSAGRAGARRFLLVQRYDRLQQNGIWRRLHQEDMCQALGQMPSAKYENNATGQRGPRVRDIVGVMRSFDPLRGSCRSLIT